MRTTRRRGQANLQSGFGLVEVMLAGTLGIVLSLVMLKVVTSNSTVAKKSESLLDQSALRTFLIGRISCPDTLNATIPRCVAGSYISLDDANNRPMIPAGGGTIGRFFVRARCTANGLDVRAAALSPAGLSNSAAIDFDGPNTASWYYGDPSDRNKPLNWVHRRATLFAPGQSELCGQMFGKIDAPSIAARECPNNQMLTQVNFYKNSVDCLPMPPACPPQTALSWNGTAFTCVPSPNDTHIRDNLILPAIIKNNEKIEQVPAECVIATRAAGGGVSGGGGFVSAIGSGKDWGMRCTKPYVSYGCHIAGSSSAKIPTPGGDSADWDLSPEDNGCSTDDEEKATGSVLAISCCKPGNPNSVP
jgi:hypothetical protein